MNIKWNEVTWYSKLGALIFFVVVVPVIMFKIGRAYEGMKQVRALNANLVMSMGNTYVNTSTHSMATTSIEQGDVDTSDWTTYMDEELGFSIKYPKNLRVVDDPGQASITLTFPPTYFSTVLSDTVAVAVYAAPTCMPIAVSNTGKISENVMINGKNFVRNEQDEGAMGTRFKTITYDIRKNAVCYRIIFNSRGTNGAGFYESDASLVKEIDAIHDTEYKKVMDIFSAILNSFVFVETPEGLNEADVGTYKLTSITPNLSSVGSKIVLTGEKFSGHDTIVWIELGKSATLGGDRGVLWGGMPTSDTSITLTIPTKVCSQYTGASGLPCPWSTTVKPGEYRVYVQNQNGRSNTLPLEIR